MFVSFLHFHFEAETLMFQEAGLNSDPGMWELSLPVYSSLNMLNTITGLTFNSPSPWTNQL